MNEVDQARFYLDQMLKDALEPDLNHLYEFLLSDHQTIEFTAEYITGVSDRIWNELSFLYQLSERWVQPGLSARIRVYWMQLIRHMRDPEQFLMGQHVLVKTLHVRIHSFLIHAPQNTPYDLIWSEIGAKLITYLDDFMLGEIL
jgi:hypothetical protein